MSKRAKIGALAPARSPAKRFSVAKRPPTRLPERKDLQRHLDATSNLIKATNDDIAKARTELLFFLGAVAFILVTTFGVDDRALLIGTRINLPLFGASIDLQSFLSGAPILLVCIHFVILLKFRTLHEKCNAIDTRLGRSRSDDPAQARTLGLQVISNFLTQFMVGDQRSGVVAWFNWLVYVACLYLAPIATLLFLMLRTLPLHSEYLTTLQLAVLFADAWLSVFVIGSRRFWAATVAAALFAAFFGLFFSVPDSHLDRLGRALPISAAVPYGLPHATRRAFWPTAYFLESEVDISTGRPVRLFSRNLVVVNGQLGADEAEPRITMEADDDNPVGAALIPADVAPLN